MYRRAELMFMASDIGTQAGFLTASISWMFLALLGSAGAAYLTLASLSAFNFVAKYTLLFVISELALVVILSGAINRLSPPVAVLMVISRWRTVTVRTADSAGVHHLAQRAPVPWAAPTPMTADPIRFLPLASHCR